MIGEATRRHASRHARRIVSTSSGVVAFSCVRPGYWIAGDLRLALVETSTEFLHAWTLYWTAFGTGADRNDARIDDPRIFVPEFWGAREIAQAPAIGKLRGAIRDALARGPDAIHEVDRVEAGATRRRDASQRACAYLAQHGSATAGQIGNHLWHDRTRKRAYASHGGGDYAAQMLLGRLKKAGLVQHAVSRIEDGPSMRWELTQLGRRSAGGNLP